MLAKNYYNNTRIDICYCYFYLICRRYYHHLLNEWYMIHIWQEYEVESIVDHKAMKGKIHFFVKVGYNDYEHEYRNMNQCF